MTHLFGLCVALFFALAVLHACLLLAWGAKFYVVRALKVYGVFILAWNLLTSMGLQERLIVTITLGVFWAFKMAFMVNLMNSVSIGMLRKLDRSPGKKMSRHEFFQVFSTDRILVDRLTIMRANGLLEGEKEGDLLTLTPKGHTMAAAFRGIQRVLRIRWVG